jgi:hypothetical protein
MKGSILPARIGKAPSQFQLDRVIDPALVSGGGLADEPEVIGLFYRSRRPQFDFALCQNHLEHFMSIF